MISRRALLRRLALMTRRTSQHDVARIESSTTILQLDDVIAIDAASSARDVRWMIGIMTTITTLLLNHCD
jgi:hypothetical protein